MPVATFYLQHLKKQVKLGRNKPRVRALTLHLRNYLLAHLAAPPSSVDYTQKVSSWPMYRNDVLGDCVIADGGHEIECWTANNGAGSTVTFTDDQITQLYTAIGGYDPTKTDPTTGNNPTDNGCVITDMLNYLKTTGYPGGHMITGYVSVDNSNQQELQQACYLFETVTLGISLPDSWLNPSPGPGFVWDNDTPDPKNGHCVPVVGYNSQGVQVVSWGMVGTITWAAVTNTAIVDEAYAKVSSDIFSGQGTAPSGFNMVQLVADLQQLSGNSQPS